jgi:hypothetical protein
LANHRVIAALLQMAAFIAAPARPSMQGQMEFPIRSVLLDISFLYLPSDDRKSSPPSKHLSAAA